MTETLRADARRNRERILEAAQDLLAARGLSVPIDDIAHLAGVGVGTVYRHFPTKEALYEAIVLARMEHLVEIAKEFAAGADPVESFLAFMRTTIDRAAEDRAVMERIGDAVDVHEVKASIKVELDETILALLRRAQKAGGIRRDIGLPEVLALLSGACVGFNAPNVDAAVRARGIDVLLSGLRPA